MTPRIKNTINYVIYILLVALSVMAMTESRGILRTFPFVLILPAVATFFVNKKLVTIFLCFATTLFLCFSEDINIGSAVFPALFAGIFSATGILSKRFFITAHIAQDKRKLFVFPGVLLLILGVAGYFAVFGNPISAFSAKNENIAYIEERYGEDAPNIRHTYYDFSKKTYFTNVSFIDQTYMNADIGIENGKIYDGYSNYYEYKLLSTRRNEMAKLLGGHFADGRFALRINTSQTDISASAKEAQEPQKFYGKMVFDLAFYDQLRETEDFVNECERCAEYLKKAGIEFASVNYYGAFADEFLFEMNVPFGFDGDYSVLAEDFSGDTFERYYDESDYADGWYYGK
ncbi:MAG: hypothetical protein IKV97_02700 [Clostridia bacterium]|nr:hypothetical protein [Clostridia bacterium]